MTEELPDSKPAPLDEATGKAQLAADVPKRQKEGRTAEDYLRIILSNAQYITNVAEIIEKARDEIKNSAIYTSIERKATKEEQLNQEELSLQYFLSNTRGLTSSFLQGLKVAEQLATGSNGKLGNIMPIMQLHADGLAADTALKYIATQVGRPEGCGISDKTIIHAQAARDEIKNKLLGIFHNHESVRDAMTEYNDNYAKRIVAANRDLRGNDKAEVEGDNIERWKGRQVELVNGYKDTSKKREMKRTLGYSFTERVEASTRTDTLTPGN